MPDGLARPQRPCCSRPRGRGEVVAPPRRPGDTDSVRRLRVRARSFAERAWTFALGILCGAVALYGLIGWALSDFLGGGGWSTT